MNYDEWRKTGAGAAAISLASRENFTDRDRSLRAAFEAGQQDVIERLSKAQLQEILWPWLQPSTR